MRSQKWKKVMAVLMAAALVIAGAVVPDGVSAKGRMKLNKKKVTMKVGRKIQLRLKNAKGKVTWKSSRKKVATVTGKGVVKGKKKGTAKITAKCRRKKFVCKVKVLDPGESVIESGSPEESLAPGATAAPGTSAQPSASASAKPSTELAGTSSLKSSRIKPASAAADTLAIGTFAVTLGMTKAQVQSGMGEAPDRTGTSPQGFESYVYNPSNDYVNYLEMQFKDDKVVEISTISAYFCYDSLVSSGDTAETLQGRGFKTMSRFAYEAGYQYEKGNAYVNAFVDHQQNGGVYGVQVFDKKLNSKLDKLIIPKYCTYTSDVAKTMRVEMGDFVNAFRVFKGKEPMKVEASGTAQTQAEYMASIGKNTTSDQNGRTYDERFTDEYGECYMQTEFAGDSCEDAFSFVVFAVDTTKNTASGQLSNIYQYMIAEDGPDGGTVDMHVCCGFAYNTTTKLYTFGVIDLFGF